MRNARLNARLVETEARARDLVEQSPDTIIVHTAEVVAQQAGMSYEDLAAQTTANARRIYRI